MNTQCDARYVHMGACKPLHPRSTHTDGSHGQTDTNTCARDSIRHTTRNKTLNAQRATQHSKHKHSKHKAQLCAPR